MAGAPFMLDHIRLGDRPLLVCDIDEVVLEYLSPFGAFLRSHGHDLLPRSFRLHGNIIDSATGEPALDAVVDALPGANVLRATDWSHAARLIRAHFARPADE